MLTAQKGPSRGVFKGVEDEWNIQWEGLVASSKQYSYKVVRWRSMVLLPDVDLCLTFELASRVRIKTPIFYIKTLSQLTKRSLTLFQVST